MGRFISVGRFFTPTRHSLSPILLATAPVSHSSSRPHILPPPSARSFLSSCLSFLRHSFTP